jgi:hypothetical protein
MDEGESWWLIKSCFLGHSHFHRPVGAGVASNENRTAAPRSWDSTLCATHIGAGLMVGLRRLVTRFIAVAA